MRNILRASLLIAALFPTLVYADAVNGVGQEPIAGGYAAASKDDPEVKSAARFAVASRRRKDRRVVKLLSVEAAEQQVVAGMNYRLCLKVKTKGKGRRAYSTEDVKVVVFKSLKNTYELTSWEPGDCAAAH